MTNNEITRRITALREELSDISGEVYESDARIMENLGRSLLSVSRRVARLADDMNCEARLRRRQEVRDAKEFYR